MNYSKSRNNRARVLIIDIGGGIGGPGGGLGGPGGGFFNLSSSSGLPLLLLSLKPPPGPPKPPPGPRIPPPMSIINTLARLFRLLE